MADVNFAAIAAALNARFADRISSTVNRTVLFAQVVPVVPASSKNLQWDAEFGTAVGTAIADGAAVSTFDNDDLVPAVLQYAIHHNAFKVTGLARALALASGNPREIADIWLHNLKNCVKRQAKGISQQMYLGDGSTGPQQIHGVTPAAGVAAIGDTGVYATIDRAVRTAWQANVIDALLFDAVNNPTGRFNLTVAGEPAPEGIKMLRASSRAIYDASSEPYDLIVTSSILHEAYGLSFNAERRWVDSIRTANGQVKLDKGYQVLEFDGRMMIQDGDCPADEMLFLNTDEMEISQVSDVADHVNGASGTAQLEGTPDEFLGAGNTKLTARIQPLGIDGDAFPFALYSYLQLKIANPNRFARVTNLIP